MEMEDPTEKLQEDIHHHATHNQGERWVSFVALTTAIVAVIAAICGLLAGHYGNEAILEQIKASDNWAYYQAKQIKIDVLSSKIELLTSLNKEPSDKDIKRLSKYKKDGEELKTKAEKESEESKLSLTIHETLSKGVTLFQIAIAVAAISILTKRKLFFGASFLFSIGGIIFFILGLIS